MSPNLVHILKTCKMGFQIQVKFFKYFLFTLWCLDTWEGKVSKVECIKKKNPNNSMGKFSETGGLLLLLLPLFCKRNVDILIAGLISRCLLCGKQQLICLLFEFLLTKQTCNQFTTSLKCSLLKSSFAHGGVFVLSLWWESLVCRCRICLFL